MTHRGVLGWRPAAALLASAVLAFAVLPQPRPAHAAPLDGVCDDLRAEAEAFDGHLGFVVLDLTDGTRCSSSSDEVFRTASLYKLIVLAEAYAQEEAGTFSFEEPIVVLRPAAPDAEDGSPRTLTMSAREAARLMIQVSDNDTAEALRTRLGKENVAAAPPGLGMPDTTLGLGFTTTPDDIARYLMNLYAWRLVSPASDAAIMELLLGQQVNDRIPWFLPDEVPIAHKTGRLDRFAHDAGIVFAPGGPYLIALLTEGAQTQQQGYEAIRSLAQISYRAFAEERPPAPAPLPSSAALEAVASPEAVLPTERAPVAEPPVAASAALEAVASPEAVLPTERAPVAEPPVAAPAATAEAIVPVQPAAEGGGAGLRLPSLGGGGTPWWQTEVGLLSLLGAIALVPAALFGLRRRQQPLPQDQAANDRAVRPTPLPARVWAGGSTMRMRITGRRGATTARAVQPYMPAAGEGRDPDAKIASPRLQRLSSYFRAQLELMEEMSRQMEAETRPLIELLARQRGTVERVLENLEDRLGPIREYAESEEANLDSLQERMKGDGMGSIARSFSDYVAQQRQRIAETHQRVDGQREPFEQLALDQRDAVELALSRFDSDIAVLEGNLSEQRRVLMHLLDSLRSEDFHEVREFLGARDEALAAAAERGITDPAEIVASMQALRPALHPGGGNAQLDRALEEAEEADERLLNAGGPPAIHALQPPDRSAASAKEDEAPPRKSTTA